MTFRRTMFAAALVLGSVSAVAQTPVRFMEYSAKFLCGAVEEKSSGGPVRPGFYETSINIHNPELPVGPVPGVPFMMNVTFVKKVVLSLPEGETPIAPSRFRRDNLQSDFAEQVDCKIIRAMLGPAGAAPFIEGFVVLIVFPTPLTTPHELDVVGVYSVNTPTQSIALEIVPVAPHVVTFSLAAGKAIQEKLLEQSKRQ